MYEAGHLLSLYWPLDVEYMVTRVEFYKHAAGRSNVAIKSTIMHGKEKTKSGTVIKEGVSGLANVEDV